MDNFDAIDLAFLGMGSYINEKDTIPEENKDFEELKEIKIDYSIKNTNKKQILRPFEQFVQKSIDKIKI